MRKRLFAWVYARFDRRERRSAAPARAALVSDLEGAVLEIGCGTGANFEHYPPGASVIATDYSEHMLRRARSDAEQAAAEIEVRQADAGDLPFDDASFDAAVSTLVLCSVPDPERALAELRRVLRPGGELRLLEHVRSDRNWVAALQRVASPPWAVLADGCRLDRDTRTAVTAAGFEIVRDDMPRLTSLPLKQIALSARRPA